MYDTRWQRDDRIAALQLSMLNEEAGPLLRVRRDVSAPPSSTSSLDYNSTLITRSSVISSTTATTTTTTTTTLPQLNVTNTRPSTARTTSPTSSTTTTIGTTTTTPVTASVPDRESTTQNLTVMEDMNHKYYTSYVVTGKKAESLWIDEEQLASYHSKIHSSLSNNYRVAATVKLSFTFLFYGHEVKQVTIATGGFLYVSEFLHQWLTATQYIAPLMANFDTHIGNSSNIHYADTGSFFVVWWQDVYLKDYPQAGPFSFQAVIHQNGRVIFNYKQVPLDITDIPKAQHPVKIGLSDAYYYDTSTGSGMKRTIYEYHRVEITADRIFNSSSVIIQPLETCIQQKTCEQCLSANISFKCQYCLELRRCSDGLDRYRQEWLNHSCHTQETITLDQCPAPGSLSPPSAIKGRHDINEGAIVAVVFIIVLILVITVVIFYGYLRPQSKIGLWLIEHRPSQLRERLSNVHFFKRRDGGAEKYEVSVQPDGESVA